MGILKKLLKKQKTIKVIESFHPEYLYIINKRNSKYIPFSEIKKL